MTNRCATLAVLLMVLGLNVSAVLAQGPPLPSGDNAPPAPLNDRDDNGPPSPKLNVLDQLPGVFGTADDEGPKIFFNARFDIESGTQVGRVHVTAEPAPGWHTYSITQKKGGPIRTTLQVTPSTKFSVAGPFTPDQAPKVVLSTVFKDPETKQALPVEEHHQAVTWSAPIELARGTDPQQLQIAIKFDGQICKDSCMDLKEDLIAKFDGFYTLAKPTGEYQAESGHVTWKGHIEPQVVTPGSKAKLVFTATPVKPFHVYAYQAENKKKGFLPTLIALRSIPAEWKQATARTDAEIITKPTTVPGNSDQVYHEVPVTWTIDLTIPETAAKGKVELKGLIGFQTCESGGSCDLPAAVAFQVPLHVGDSSKTGETLVTFDGEADYLEAQELAKATAPLLERTAEVVAFSPGALLTAMGFALLGGLILNVMPCVLPVIPLKLLSFVEQAGQSRAKLMTYNLVYAAGTIAVFLVLAVVGIVFGLGWGEQFAITEFQIIVTLFMFAMTLSLLGLWEIPLPGAIGSGEAVGSENAGSLVAAFWKGSMTTIYATPCSGPFLGIALGATIGFPAYATLLVFFAAGLGFASPYIFFGLLMAQNPSITRIIPKPGVWMEHVKQGLGFVMLAVVVWWYFPQIDSSYHMPTLFAAIGIALGCWMIGKVPPYAERNAKLMAWGGAAGSIALVSWIAFTFLGPHTLLLPWQPYSEEALAAAQEKGQTVMIEFTADWCPNCKVNMSTAIDTKAVHEAVKSNNVVVLLADWSDRNDAIRRKLEELNSKSIPLLAVYPGSGGEPIVLRDIVFQSNVLNALEKAGPSVGVEEDVSQASSTAMTTR